MSIPADTAFEMSKVRHNGRSTFKKGEILLGIRRENVEGDSRRVKGKSALSLRLMLEAEGDLNGVRDLLPKVDIHPLFV
jgi:hypothetical protein